MFLFISLFLAAESQRAGRSGSFRPFTPRPDPRASPTPSRRARRRHRPAPPAPSCASVRDRSRLNVYDTEAAAAGAARPRPPARPSPMCRRRAPDPRKQPSSRSGPGGGVTSDPAAEARPGLRGGSVQETPVPRLDEPGHQDFEGDEGGGRGPRVASGRGRAPGGPGEGVPERDSGLPRQLTPARPTQSGPRARQGGRPDLSLKTRSRQAAATGGAGRWAGDLDRPDPARRTARGTPSLQAFEGPAPPPPTGHTPGGGREPRAAERSRGRLGGAGTRNPLGAPPASPGPRQPLRACGRRAIERQERALPPGSRPLPRRT